MSKSQKRRVRMCRFSIDPVLLAQLERVSAATGQTRSALIVEALMRGTGTCPLCGGFCEIGTGIICSWCN